MLLITDVESINKGTSDKDLANLTAKDRVILLSKQGEVSGEETLSISVIQKLLALPAKPEIVGYWENDQAPSFAAGMWYGRYSALAKPGESVKMYYNGIALPGLAENGSPAPHRTARKKKVDDTAAKPSPTPAKPVEAPAAPAEHVVHANEGTATKKSRKAVADKDVSAMVKSLPCMANEPDAVITAVTSAITGASDREIGLKTRLQFLTPADFNPTDEQIKALQSVYDKVVK